MRALGFALVTASIALSAGGVVYRRQAQAQAVAAPAAIPAEEEMCHAPAQEPVVERRARIAAAPEDGGSVISLGTRGYNYSRPGDPTPTETRSPEDAPAAPRD